MLAIGQPATSAATAVNRFSIPAAGLATDPVLVTDLATDLARAPNPAAAEPTLVAIVPTEEPTSRIAARVNGEVQERELRIVRQARERPIVEEASSSPAVVAVAAVCVPVAAVAGARWHAAAAVAVAEVALAGVAADGAPISG